MPKIEKRIGNLEKFEPEKLKMSVTRAGLSEEAARKIMRSIKVEEGMKSNKLRSEVITQLKTLDKKAAKKYQAFRKPTTEHVRW